MSKKKTLPPKAKRGAPKLPEGTIQIRASFAPKQSEEVKKLKAAAEKSPLTLNKFVALAAVLGRDLAANALAGIPQMEDAAV